MLMPETLSADLQKYAVASNPSELLERLTQHTSEAVAFFMAASDDETWCERHSSFMSDLVAWMRDQLLWHEMDHKLAYAAAKKMQAKSSFFPPLEQANLICEMRDCAKPINSFFFQAISQPFFYLIRKECRAKQQEIFAVKNLSQADFEILEEFIYTGESSVLWTINSSEAPRVLKLALSWGLPELALICEHIFVRDLDDENVFDRLAIAQQYALKKLQAACLDKLNDLHSGISLSANESGALNFELKEATEATLNLLQTLQYYVSMLICGAQVIEETAAMEIAASCPKLIALDLSQTKDYHDNLKIISHKIQELTLTDCFWLNDSHFRKLVTLFPSIVSLNLSGSGQLSSALWGELIKLRALRNFSVARCPQVGDQELLLILNSARTLEELDLSECRQVTARGFHALAVCTRPLTRLHLARTELEDVSLLELASRLPRLSQLDLTRCQYITEEGIIEAVRLLPALRQLHVAQTNISAAALETISKLRPLLEIYA